MTAEVDRVAVRLEDWPDDVDSDEGVVINWFVHEGATVEESQILCEIQIEKVDMDVYAPTDGTLAEIVVGEDGEFARDDVLAWLAP